MNVEKYGCEYMLNTHLISEFRKHTYENTKIFPFRCSLCEYGTIRKDSLDTHIKSKHEEKVFKTKFII
jgi:hypothetical protein